LARATEGVTEKGRGKGREMQKEGRPTVKKKILKKGNRCKDGDMVCSGRVKKKNIDVSPTKVNQRGRN